MKKMNFLKACVFLVLFILSFLISNKNDIGDISLSQTALACNIVPETVDDYCWEVEYTSPYSYNCYEGGIWSCYV